MEKLKSAKNCNKRKQCSAKNCKNYQFNSRHLAFHRFPKDPDRCAKWVQNLRNASLREISSQRLHQSYRVCSAHFHSSQFKRPSDVHAGLKWNAVPTRVNGPNSPPPLDLESRGKPPKSHQLPLKKRKMTHVVHPSNEGPSAPKIVQQLPRSSPDAPAAGSLVAAIPPVPQMALVPDPESAAKERTMKMKIRSLQSQVCKLKAKVRELKQQKMASKTGVKKDSVITQLKKLLPAKAYAFVSAQIRMSQRKAHGFRWTTQDKAFFLALLHANPKCYRDLLKVFTMPSPRTLQIFIKSTDFKPGFNQNILATMKKAMESAKPLDKVCTVITGEMSLKQAVHYNVSGDRIEGFEDFGKGQRTPYVANCASAFMVRGLFRNWKQLFGYCFTSGPIPHTRLRSLLLEAICELRNAGMECLVFICDQGARNSLMLVRLGVTKEKPYVDVNGVRVFCLWDPPHLMKKVRNSWRNHGFALDGDDITWAILEDLYTYDSKQDIRLCCCLTKKHVYLPASASGRVKFATQVLSHAVAVGIKTLAQIKQLTGQAQRNYMAAAKFCENFDGIFNCFNSKQHKDPHKLKSALSNASAHFPFLEKCMEWLPRLTLGDSCPGTKQIPCVEGWQHNIVCLKMIWCDLRERHQVSSLLTNSLQKDCLENAYSIIRTRGGNRGNPDSVQFECQYRAAATGLMFNNSETTNCEQDLGNLLLQFSTYGSQKCPRIILNTEIMDEHSYFRVTTDCKSSDAVLESDVNIPDGVLDLLSHVTPPVSAAHAFDHDGSGLVYIAGYIGSKAVGKFTDCKDSPCKECNILTTDIPADSRYTFLKDKQNTNLSLGDKDLNVPSVALLNSVTALECNFQKKISSVFHTVGLERKLVASSMETVREWKGGVCDKEKCKKSLIYMVRLFIRIRIHHILRAQNQQLSEPDQKSRRKIFKN